jgi:hypothetical protein
MKPGESNPVENVRLCAYGIEVVFDSVPLASFNGKIHSVLPSSPVRIFLFLKHYQVRHCRVKPWKN